MRTCERCGDDVSWTCDTVEMIGGVPAHLCNGCRREFNDFILASSEYEVDVKLAAREAYYSSLAMAKQPVSQEEWESLAADKSDMKRAFALLSKAFLAGKPALTASQRGSQPDA